MVSYFKKVAIIRTLC